MLPTSLIFCWTKYCPFLVLYRPSKNKTFSMRKYFFYEYFLITFLLWTDLEKIIREYFMGYFIKTWQWSDKNLWSYRWKCNISKKIYKYIWIFWTWRMWSSPFQQNFFLFYLRLVLSFYVFLHFLSTHSILSWLGWKHSEIEENGE